MPFKEFDIHGIGKVKIYKRRGSRNVRLTVAADGAVRVTVPYWAPYQAGANFAASRRAWIAAQGRQKGTSLQPGQIIGKSHHLFFEQSATVDMPKTSVKRGQIVVVYRFDQTAEDPDVQAAAVAASWRALRQQTRQLLGKRLAELAQAHGFVYRSFAAKRMKTRWGSCDQHGNIVLNIFLVQLPWEYIDYVILHELVHTQALNHGPDFWRLLESHLPGARAQKRAMKQFQPALFPTAPSPQA